MEILPFRLRGLPLSLRIAVACLIVILGGGYIASVAHMIHHYENKDERPGLSMDDIVGSFHGVNREAGLAVALNGSMRQYVNDAEFAALMEWLAGDRISEDYDNPDLGMLAPAEIIDRQCLHCHSRNATEGEGIGATVPLEYYDDVKALAFSKRLDPVPLAIVTVSTHTHALSMALVTALASLLFLATSWPFRARCLVVMLGFAALLLDLASWWLARWSEPFCTVLVAAGGLYGLALAVQLAAAFFDLWFGRRLPASGAAKS